MEISDLYVACQWAKEKFGPIGNPMGELGIGQPEKDYKGQLINHLYNIDFDELSDQQYKIVSSFGITSYAGPVGAADLEEALRKSANDPVAQNGIMQTALTIWSDSLNAIQDLEFGIQRLGFHWGPPKEILDGVVIHLHFDSEAKISEVAELKRWSNDWYDIARGITACVDGKPEDIRIIGASTGSVILTLVAIATTAKLLASISVAVAQILQQIQRVRMDQEDYRHKKIMNQKIEDGFQDAIDHIRSHAAENVVNQVIGSTASVLPPEIVSQLNLAIEKFIVYTEKGGEIDLIAPADSKSTDNDLNVARKEILQFKNQVRAIRSEMKRLTPPTSQR